MAPSGVALALVNCKTFWQRPLFDNAVNKHRLNMIGLDFFICFSACSSTLISRDSQRLILFIDHHLYLFAFPCQMQATKVQIRKPKARSLKGVGKVIRGCSVLANLSRLTKNSMRKIIAATDAFFYRYKL
jgi:hypothetical protein